MITAADTKPAERVRWGIVGLGDVCRKKSGPPFYKCSNSELVAACRRTPGAAAAFARTVPGGTCTGYDDLDAFLSHPGLDAVYVATPPGSHLEVARRVAAAGKHAYVEKPVGRCGRETREIAGLFAEAGATLYTAYISRAYERTAAVRSLLESGAIGPVKSVKYTLRGGLGGIRGLDDDGKVDLPWRLVAEQAGGGLIMDVGCHVIDRIDYLCGPLVNVSGAAKKYNSPSQDVEDYVQLRAEIGNCDWGAVESAGATVECTWDFGWTGGSVDEFVITGTKGSISMVGMSPYLPITLKGNDGEILKELTFEAPEHTAQSMIQLVTDDILNSSRNSGNVVSLADNAIRTSLVLDTILDKYYGGRSEEFWKRIDSWPGVQS